MNDDFYIGWEPRTAPGIERTTRKVVIVLMATALLVPIMLAVSQRLIGVSAFEWGSPKTFTGVLEAQPYPHLLVPRPGKADGMSRFSTYYLVAVFKHGLDAGALASLTGKTVTLKGTLIYRENQTMIETRPDWIKETAKPLAMPDIRPVALGKQTLTGEIVDSKCFLGVMNPGQLTPHRACAIRCISGGIPPVLLVRQPDGPAIYLLLVSAEGKPVNQQVLDLVAEPVQITGEVERHGELLVMRADPSTYRRMSH